MSLRASKFQQPAACVSKLASPGNPPLQNLQRDYIDLTKVWSHLQSKSAVCSFLLFF